MKALDKLYEKYGSDPFMTLYSLDETEANRLRDAYEAAYAGAPETAERNIFADSFIGGADKPGVIDEFYSAVKSAVVKTYANSLSDTDAAALVSILQAAPMMARLQICTGISVTWQEIACARKAEAPEC